MHAFLSHSQGGSSEQALCKDLQNAALLPTPHSEVESLKVIHAMLLARLFCNLLTRQHAACSLSAGLALKSNLPGGAGLAVCIWADAGS